MYLQRDNETEELKVTNVLPHKSSLQVSFTGRILHSFTDYLSILQEMFPILEISEGLKFFRVAEK